MHNNDIKHVEAGKFTAYLNSLTRRERAEFIKYVAAECGVSRSIVYNWRYMCTRIPESAKKVIEKAADFPVFEQTSIFFTPADSKLTDFYAL